MNRIALAGAVSASLLAMIHPAAARAAEYRALAKPIRDQYIVVLKGEYASLEGEARRGGTQPVADIADDMAARYGASLLHTYRRALRGFAVRMPEQALARLMKDPRVEYVEQDGLAHAATTQASAPWGLDRIDQREAVLDGNFSYVAANIGAGVHAYVIDTGLLATHTQFTGRVGAGHASINDGNGTNDCNGHGTHVAGILAGKTYGVAKGATIHAVRVLDCSGVGSWSQIIDGIDWVISNHASPAVANISIGGAKDTSADTAVANLVAAGVTTTIAAGNGNGNACLSSPADVASAITVASMRKTDDGRSSFSNYGSCVDIFAPGSDITSAWIGGNSSVMVESGTSMAAPNVAGIAAVYLGTNNAAKPAAVWTYLKDHATQSRVRAPGAGSPNLLAYSGNDSGASTKLPAGIGAPAVDLECDGSSGGNRYTCTATATKPAGAPIAYLWFKDTVEKFMYGGSCVNYTPPKNSTTWVNVTVPVTVGNYDGTTTVSKTFSCFLGGEIQ